MVRAWREARRDPFLIAEGLLEMARIERPSRKELGAAAVVGEFLWKSIHNLSAPKR